MTDHAFKVGDYVTRTGDDVHQVVGVDEMCEDYAEFKCVHPGQAVDYVMGEVEFNTMERYQPVSQDRLRELGLV